MGGGGWVVGAVCLGWMTGSVISMVVVLRLGFLGGRSLSLLGGFSWSPAVVFFFSFGSLGCGGGDGM